MKKIKYNPRTSQKLGNHICSVNAHRLRRQNLTECGDKPAVQCPHSKTRRQGQLCEERGLSTHDI